MLCRHPRHPVLIIRVYSALLFVLKRNHLVALVLNVTTCESSRFAFDHLVEEYRWCRLPLRVACAGHIQARAVLLRRGICRERWSGSAAYSRWRALPPSPPAQPAGAGEFHPQRSIRRPRLPLAAIGLLTGMLNINTQTPRCVMLRDGGVFTPRQP